MQVAVAGLIHESDYVLTVIADMGTGLHIWLGSLRRVSQLTRGSPSPSSLEGPPSAHHLETGIGGGQLDPVDL